MDENSDFSLDDLRVEEEEIRPPTIFPLSIIVCETEFVQPVDDVASLRIRIKNRLIGKYGFKKSERRRFKEGFLEFDGSENVIECFFASETPTKINFERDDLKIHTDRLKLINPAFSVKIKVFLDNKSARVILFGGSDVTIKRALTQMNYCIRHCVEGGHRTLTPKFSKEDMSAILKNFGLNVEYIWIHPGESEKFIKIVEKEVKGEVRRIPEYIVHAKLRGYRITGSPVTIGLIEESGIYLREIQGRFNFAAGMNVTSRISSTGKILFFIPEMLVPKGGTIYDVAEELYKKIITQRKGPKQITIGEFFVEES